MFESITALEDALDAAPRVAPPALERFDAALVRAKDAASAVDRDRLRTARAVAELSGGALGGAARGHTRRADLRSKAFFFATYEGYRENVQLNLNQVVPYQQVRDEILRALPFPETASVLEVLPLPTEPIVSSQGVVDPRIGRWRGLGIRKRTENAPLIKGEGAIFNGGSLAVTYTRLRPFTLEPRAGPEQCQRS